ncbi:MAG TPA: hypothetical protein VN789_13315, partial [Casimicrobiaceae bacterium]|nr:hypothetical protein [Casimicrobiaceae bacterium]
ALFGNQDYKNNRTELVLFVTPRVVDTMNDINTVINDLRRRMDNIDELFPGGRDSGRIYPSGATTQQVLPSPPAPPGATVPPASSALPAASAPAGASAAQSAAETPAAKPAPAH